MINTWHLRTGGAVVLAGLLAALQVQAATGGQPEAMASPPTVTTGVPNAATAIPGATRTYAWSDTAALRHLCGHWSNWSDPEIPSIAGRAYNTTNVLSPFSGYGSGGAIETNFTGRYFEIELRGSLTYIRVLIDGEYIPSLSYPADGNGHRTLIDFGTVGARHIRIEDETTNFILFNILTEDTATLVAPAEKILRLVIPGDSITEPVNSTSISYQLAKELGFRDYWVTAIGATGYINDDGPAKPNFDTRWPYDVIAPDADFYILTGGLNDNEYDPGLVQNVVTRLLNDLRSANPRCLIALAGIYDPVAPLENADFEAVNDAILAAGAAVRRVTTHDISDVAYEKVGGGDITHPNDPGRATIFAALYNSIATAYGLHAYVPPTGLTWTPVPYTTDFITFGPPDHTFTIVEGHWSSKAASDVTYAGDVGIASVVPASGDYACIGLEPTINQEGYNIPWHWMPLSGVLYAMVSGGHNGATPATTPSVSTYGVRRVGTDIEFWYALDGETEVVHRTAVGVTSDPLYLAAACPTTGVVFGPVTRT